LRQQTRVYLSLFEEGTGYALQAQGGPLNFLKTRDGGTTWTVMPDLPGIGTPRMDFGSPNVGYMAASNDLFRTLDGGETWAKVKSPTRHFVAWNTISTAQAGRTIALIGQLWRNGDGKPWESGDCNDPRQGRIVSYVSSNGGKTWTKGLLFDGPSGTFHSDFVDARNGIATLDSETDYEQTGECNFTGSREAGKTIMVTHDRGRHWDRVMDCPEPAGCMAVAMMSPKHFATVTTDARILVTFDGGRSFKTSNLDGLVELPVREHLRWGQGIAFGNDDVGYAATNGRGIWRTVDGGLTWEREVSPHELPGYSFGTVAAAGDSAAIAGGPNFLIRRFP
jgi:photosystem II stability/assembly factor-like uncharacterized protein